MQSDLLKYKEFDIPKSSSGLRHIASPQGGLKLLQRRLANLLQDCLDEIDCSTLNINKKKPGNQPSHGFKRERSILTNAKIHRNKRYVFNLDLSDFFGSINFGRVRGFFIKDKKFQLAPKVATILAQIACFKQGLPQGAPCSPVISNLIGNILDVHMVRLASKADCAYTRYADDLTFSTNKKSFPRAIAIQSDDDEHTWIPGPELLRLVNRSGFKINHKKTRMQYFFSRQDVTGLVVNKKINIRREYRHNVRAMVHHLFTKGDFFIIENVKNKDGDFSLEKKQGELSQLHGRLGFIDSIDQHNEENSGSIELQPSKKNGIYRKFLFYKEIYAATKPVLICEGWTDYVYIENAIHSLAPNYPSLVSSDKTGKTNFAIKRFKYSGSRTGKILGINGGTGDLGEFIKSYRKESKNFSVPGMKEPVILILDNDKAGQKIVNLVGHLFKVKINKTDPYIHVFRNLYIVLTPLKNNQAESEIEDLFEASTLAIQLDGKFFNRSNEKTTDTSYGKAVFAKKIVNEMASSINFDGFSPLLDRITKVIQIHYKQREGK